MISARKIKARSSYEGLIRTINVLEQNIRSMPENERPNAGMFGEMLRQSGSYIKFIEKWLDPKKNGFKLIKPGGALPSGREVWTDGPAIMVNRYDNIIDIIGKR